METAKQKLIDHGVKPTAQRASILEFLLNTTSHPTADEVHTSVSSKLPVKISRATVYNTLNLLVQRGVIKEVSTEPGRLRYDAKINDHHHFVDLKSGKVYDIEAKFNLELCENPILEEKFKVDYFQITFYGEIEQTNT